MKKKKEPLRPLWTTTVYPDEYDYFEQFSGMVKRANETGDCFCYTDVGKVWGLVLAYKELKNNCEQLDEKTKSEIEIPKKNNTPKAFVIHPEGRIRINIE